MEPKLLAIVTKVEKSSLTPEEKEALYDTIAAALRSAVWPALYRHMPKDKLEALTHLEGKAAVDMTTEILSDAVKDPSVYEDTSKLFDELFVEVNKALAAEGIS